MDKDIYEYPVYYDSFRCIGGTCKDSCCAGWEVDIDPDTASMYRSCPLPIGGRLRKELTEKPDGTFVFPLTASKRCPFLNDRNLCDIILAMGDGGLSLTCTEYPRYFEEYGSYHEADLTLSCPEFARIFFSEDGPVEYMQLDHEIHDPDWEDDPFDDDAAEDADRNDGDEAAEDSGAEEGGLPEDAGAGDGTEKLIDMQRLREVLELRDRMMEILRDRTKSLDDRFASIDALFPDRRKDTDAALLGLLGQMETVNPAWDRILQNIRQHPDETAASADAVLAAGGDTLSHALERFAEYLVFRYMIDICFHGDRGREIRFLRRAYRTLVLLLGEWGLAGGTDLPRGVLEDRARIFSRQVEHSDRNMDILFRG